MSNGMLDSLSVIGGEWLDSLLHPMAQSFGDMLFYALISDFIRNEIDNFGFNLMERVSALVGTAALTIITIWVLLQGYRIISGQSRDSLMALVLNVARVTLIVMAATTIGVAGKGTHKFITDDLQTVIASAVTGDENTTLDEQIDDNLAAMQFAMASIDAINIVQDPTLNDDKKRALMMVGVGTAGPAMIGGAMLLMYKVALALFVGLGPLFVLCLIFDQTKAFFQRWLMYGISTMFSMAVLAAMLSISAKLVLGVAGAFWTTTTLGALTGLSLNDGMTTIALQQGGVGLLLTVLIVTTPPMAANFFNGAVGSFSSHALLGNSSAYQNPRSMPGRGGGTPNYSSGRQGANPGESGYRGGDAPTGSGYGRVTGSGGMSQSPQQTSSNNAASSNYGNTPMAAQPSGLRGAASASQGNANANANAPQQPSRGET